MTSSTRLVAGIHSARNALKHGAESISEVWIDQQRHDRRLKEVIAQLNKQKIPFHQVSRQDIDKLAPDINHQGIVIRAKALAAGNETELETILLNAQSPLLILILDGVQDPHNLGACLRTADAAGVDVVIAPRDKSAGLTPTVSKVASGAAESVPFVQVTNLARTLKMLADAYRVWIIGTAGEAADTLYNVDLTGNLAIVMGGEQKGMRRLTRDHCDQLVKLPMLGDVASLNVSVATGVALYEVVRQRQLAG